MNYFFIFYLLLFFNIKTYSNIYNTNDKYYEFVSNAESNIIDGNYKTANSSYLKASKVNKNMYGIDVYNALICSVYLKDWESVNFWSEKLLKKGIKKSFFSASIYNQYKKTKQWEKLEKKIDYYEIKGNQDLALIAKLDSLLIEDQKEYCGIPIGETTYDEAKQTTNSIDEKLLQIIDKYGFPDEEKIGLEVYQDTLISVDSKYAGLYRHSYQANSKRVLKILNDNISNGKLDKRIDFLLSEIETFLVTDCYIYKIKKSLYTSEENLTERKILFFNNFPKSHFRMQQRLTIIDSKTKKSDPDVEKSYLEKYYTKVEKFNNCEY